MASKVHHSDQLVFTGATPWHGLGHHFEAPPTVEDLQQGPFRWTAEMQALQTVDGIPIGTHRAVVRSDNKAPLGVVGQRYDILQPAEMAELCRPLVDAGLDIETAGWLGQGEDLWVLMRGETAEVRPGDEVHDYLLFTRALDGTRSNRLLPTPTRVVCNNTLTYAMGRGEKRAVKAKSTANQRQTLRGIIKQLAEAREGWKAGLETFRHLATKQVHPELYFEAVMRAHTGATDPADELSSRTKNTLASILETYESLPTEDRRSDSAWDAYNGMTRYLTHDRGGAKKTHEQRTTASAFGSGAKMHDAALKIAVLMADGSTVETSAYEASKLVPQDNLTQTQMLDAILA